MKDFDTSLYFITDSTGYEENEFLARVDLRLMKGFNSSKGDFEVPFGFT